MLTQAPYGGFHHSTRSTGGSDSLLIKMQFQLKLLIRRVVIHGLLLTILFLCYGNNLAHSAENEISPGQLDHLIRDIRVNLFNESPDAPGVPGILADDIDLNLVRSLYGKPGALKAIQRIFSGKPYEKINQKLGNFRETANLRIWAQLVDRLSIRIELNNAGKRNGAVSDLDNTAFTDETSLIDPLTGRVIQGAEQVHKYLVEEHAKLWEAEFGVSPASFDTMHFGGDGLMQDWRMSKRNIHQFAAQIDSDIARLSATDGAYFVPGAYKPQVFGEYLKKGGTIIIEPVLGTEPGTNGIEAQGVPEGVLIRAEARTSDVSLLYKDVPFAIDKTGALGGVLHNYQYAEGYDNPIKKAKHHIRWVDGLLSSFTNLEMDWRRLVVTGKNRIRDYQVKKLFGDLFDQGLLPREVGDLAEARRIMDLMARIEIDKVLRGHGDKPLPKNWVDDWRKYKPQDINDPKVKIQYYEKEARAIIDSLPPDVKLSDAQLADMAESAFGEKARALAKAAAIVSGRRLFNDIFSRQGYARQVHLYGREAAQKLIIERIKGLHAALAFQTDKDLIRALLAEAPAEVRSVIELVADIANMQRDQVLERGSLTVEEMIASNQAVKLFLDTIDKENRIAMSDESVRLIMGEHMLGHLLSVEFKGDTGQEVKKFHEHVKTYLNANYPVNWMGYLSETKGNLWDIGTADGIGKVISAQVRGDSRTAAKEAVGALIGAMPIAGDIWGFADAYKGFSDKGEVNPLITFAGNKLAAQVGLGHYAAFYGQIMALYGLEMSWFQLGWHFYGEPTAEEIVSWVLMGSPSAGVFIDPYADRKDWIQKTSRFPNVPDRPRELLENSAILKQYVKLPDLPNELRKTLLRSVFRSKANRLTTEAGFEIAYPEIWREARDKYLREYDRKSGYFLRRMYLYQQTHLDFFRYAQQFDQNFERIENEPPTKYLSMDRNELKKLYPGAFTKSASGGYWDHEKMYLRDFFEKWLSEWKKQQLPPENSADINRTAEAGFFMSTAHALSSLWEKLGLSGSWEQRVINELMNAYFEGEVWDPQRPDELLARHKEQRAAATESLKSGMGRLQSEIDAQIDQAREQQYQPIRQLENALMSQELGLKLATSIVKATKSNEGDYKAKEAKIRIKIPRPVAVAGDPMPIEVYVSGDIKNLPDDLTPEMTFRKIAEHKDEKPEEVLDDDVLILLGEEELNSNIEVYEHEMVVTMRSDSNPDFKLSPIKQTVFWLGPIEEDKEEKEEEPEDESNDEETVPQVVQESDEPSDGTESVLDEDNSGPHVLKFVEGKIHVKPGHPEYEFSPGDVGLVHTLVDFHGAFDFKDHRDTISYGFIDFPQSVTLGEPFSAVASARQRNELKEFPCGDESSAEEKIRIDMTLGGPSYNLSAEKVRDYTVSCKEDIRPGFDSTHWYGEHSASAEMMMRLDCQPKGVGGSDSFPAYEYACKYSHDGEKTGSNAAEDAITKIVFQKTNQDGSDARFQLFTLNSVSLIYAPIGNAEEAQGMPYEHPFPLTDTFSQSDSQESESQEDTSTQQSGESGGNESGGQTGSSENTSDSESASRTNSESTEIDGSGRADVRHLIQEWISNAEPPSNATHGNDFKYEKWGRFVGISVEGGIASVAEKPDDVGGLSSPEYLWGKKDHLDSVDHCTLGEYIVANLEKNTTENCKARYKPIVPDLVGMLIHNATERLSKLELKPDLKVGSAAPTTGASKTIERQDIDSGSVLDKGQSVSIWIHTPYVDQIEVPNIVGLAAAKAKSTLETVGLNARLEIGGPAPKAEVTGTVQNQLPKAGAKVKKDTAIVLKIFAPSANQLTAPDVVGMAQHQAQQALESEGFKVSIIEGNTANLSDSQGTIESQIPPAGTQLRTGGKIILSVYTAPVNQRIVADYVGQKVNIAKTTIESEGLVVQMSIGDAASDQNQSGTVQQQIPAPGTVATTGDTIQLMVYSKFVATAIVPQIIGLKASQAKTLLESAGFSTNFKIGDAASDKTESGAVQASTPQSGSTAKEGAVVSVTIFSNAVDNIIVPNVIGMYKEQALLILHNEGLNGTVKDAGPASSESQADLVAKQSPSANAIASTGATIEISVHSTEQMASASSDKPGSHPCLMLASNSAARDATWDWYSSMGVGGYNYEIDGLICTKQGYYTYQNGAFLSFDCGNGFMQDCRGTDEFRAKITKIENDGKGSVDYTYRYSVGGGGWGKRTPNSANQSVSNQSLDGGDTSAQDDTNSNTTVHECGDSSIPFSGTWQNQTATGHKGSIFKMKGKYACNSGSYSNDVYFISNNIMLILHCGQGYSLPCKNSIEHHTIIRTAKGSGYTDYYYDNGFSYDAWFRITP